MSIPSSIFGQFLPLPGTPLYELAREANLLLEPSQEQQMWSLGKLNIKEKPGYITQQEIEILVDEIWDYVRVSHADNRIA